MHIEIVAGNCEVRSRQFQTERGARSVHEQPAYLHMPGMAYPLPFTISLNTAADAYAPGNYVFAPESLRTNNYGQLEFNRFGMRLVRVNVQEAKRA